MLVYRIENGLGEGPYCSNSKISLKLSNYHIGLDRAPSPESDGIKGFNPFNGPVIDTDYIFGFESIESLKSWFIKPERYGLAGEGYVCTLYEVDEKNVIFGKKQLVYNKTCASVIKYIDLINFKDTEMPEVKISLFQHIKMYIYDLIEF